MAELWTITKLRDVQQERKETIFLQVITSLKQVRLEISLKQLETPLKRF